jgi:uncharacterized protein (DUF486 family)
VINYLKPIGLLLISNVFMTYAWYGHLKDLRAKPLWIAILISWGVALLEYCFQVPANRMGSDLYTLGQLKIIQEVITMIVFAGFAILYMGAPVTRNFFYASLCLLGAVYFMFRDGFVPPS